MHNPSRILFVGSSLIFAGGVVDLAFQARATSAGKQVEVARQTGGGLRLAEHAARRETLDSVRLGGYDAVMLQEQSNTPVTDPEAFWAAVRDLVPIIRAANARPWLYMTWTDKQEFRDLDPAGDRMTRQLANAYQTNGSERSVPVIPAVLVWQRALDETDLDPYADLHYQIETGACLLACGRSGRCMRAPWRDWRGGGRWGRASWRWYTALWRPGPARPPPVEVALRRNSPPCRPALRVPHCDSRVRA